jgi:hypothetical protein
VPVLNNPVQCMTACLFLSTLIFVRCSSSLIPSSHNFRNCRSRYTVDSRVSGSRLSGLVLAFVRLPAFKLGITEFMLKYEQFIFFNLLFL